MLSRSLLRLAAGVILLVVVAIFPLVGAPVPPQRVKKPLQITPGTYKVTWGKGFSFHNTMILTADGKYSWKDGWTGSWSWNNKTRVFLVMETNDGGNTWISWWVKFDKDGKGETEGEPEKQAFAGYSFAVERKKE